MNPKRLAEIRKRVEDARGSLSTRASLQEIVTAVEQLKAHSHLDLPELLDAYDSLRDQAATLWEQANPHASTCPARGREDRAHACNCERASKANPFTNL
ncbi:MAG: hypothetical protein JST54_15610 [Deltaproteobacteria bacterium]|nr:hypothetical protein [Deltaproteobacteria bacterium]